MLGVCPECGDDAKTITESRAESFPPARTSGETDAILRFILTPIFGFQATYPAPGSISETLSLGNMKWTRFVPVNVT